jgi:hypothetical protein
LFQFNDDPHFNSTSFVKTWKLYDNPQTLEYLKSLAVKQSNLFFFFFSFAEYKATVNVTYFWTKNRQKKIEGLGCLEEFWQRLDRGK